MDDTQRQRQIREGAGLDESRINQDFLDFVNKWGTWILLILAIGLGIYVVDQRLEGSRMKRVDTAFATLDEARQQGATPERLVAIASDFRKIPGVAHSARLAAADTYMRSLRTGLQPGVTLEEGQEPVPEDLLAEDDRSFMLDQAERLYAQVLEGASGNDGMALHAANALFGLAAVAETRGDLERAAARYREVGELSESRSLEPLALVAGARLERLAGLGERPELYRQADLPEPAAEELEFVDPLGLDPLQGGEADDGPFGPVFPAGEGESGPGEGADAPRAEDPGAGDPGGDEPAAPGGGG